ncbi:hypothetical protein Bca4012_086853 [Brassica carinata]
MAPIGLTDVAITDFVVNQRHGVKGLVDIISPKTLPPCYIQLPEKRVTTEKLIMEAATTGKGALSAPVIPVIDVSDWKNPNVAEEICEAAATLGFFQIVNHGVSVDEQNELRAAGRGFFDLPTEEKKRYWEGSSVSDTAWYMTSFNPYKEAKLEWRDYLKFEYLSDQVDFAATWPTVCRTPHQLFAWTSPLASRSGGRRRVSTRRSPPRFVTVPSLCPLTLLSPPLPPCFISSVYRWVAAGLGDSNRWLWVSTAFLERWRGRGEPDLSWRRRQAGRSRVSHGVDLGQISPGGFAGVALRRCLCRSGQYSASTVSPMSPLTAALVRTSPSCSKLKRRFETHRRGLLSRWVSPPVSPAVRSSGSSVLQASEGSWSSSSASLGVLLLESHVLCSHGGTRVQPLNLCFHQPQRLEWTSLLAMAGPGLADLASHVLLSMSPSGWSAVPQTILRDEVVNHSNRMKPIGRKILEILMNNLNARMEEETLMGTLRMNVNYYPECPDPKLTVGTGHHCDINTLTLLLQDDILGSLYARYGDKWLHIPPVMGAIVVNIGDMLQILSNDRYKSVEHLVMASRFLSRISFAYYCGPSYDSVIEPLREVLENGEKPLYKPTMYSDYMKYYFARPHTGSKTIESIKLP